MRISDWSSDVCSSDLDQFVALAVVDQRAARERAHQYLQQLRVQRRRRSVRHCSVSFISGSAGPVANCLIWSSSSALAARTSASNSACFSAAAKGQAQEIGRASWRESMCTDV